MSRPHLHNASLISSFFVCCCVGAGSLPAQTVGTPEESNTIRGRVINSMTGEPLGRALVYSPDSRFAKFTDAEGRFEFEFPSVETDKSTPVSSMAKSSLRQLQLPNALMARKPGFLASEIAEDVPANPSHSEITIRLVPEALILGHVTVAASDGSDKMQVELYRRQIRNGRAHWFSVNSVISKSDGGFRFAGLSPGTYKLFTHEQLDRDPLTFDPRDQLYGYPPVYYPAANSFASASTIELSAGATLQLNLTPTRRAYYPVEIGISNMSSAVPMEVIVAVAGQKGPGYSLGYNREEQKVEGLLPDGTYTVEVLSSGPTQASGVANISVKGGSVKGQSITLVPDHAIDVRVTEEFSSTEASGVVTSFVYSGPPNPDGVNSQPPRHPRYLRLTLEPADDFGSQRGASLRAPSGPDDESLVVENVKPGRYWVRFDAVRGYVAAANCEGTDLLHHPLVVAPRGPTPPIEVTLRDDAAQLDGTIEDAATTHGPAPSATAKQAHIYLVPLPDSIGQFREIWASPGNFSSGQVAPGDYRVLAFDRLQPNLEYTSEEVMRKYDGKAQLVRLLPGQKQQLSLRLTTGSD